ncbi:MAG: universal stress protein, partial [Pseudomonadota bacterium]
MCTRILVPVDLNNTDKLTKALTIAARIAREHDAMVVYVGVVDAVPTVGKVQEGARAAEALGRFAAAQGDVHGIKTEVHVSLRSDLHLNVGSDVIEAAKETDCDLIVMASHVPGLVEHILSSNAGYVA